MWQVYLSLALLPVVPDWTLKWVLELVHYLHCLGLLIDVATQFCLDAVGLHPLVRVLGRAWSLAPSLLWTIPTLAAAAAAYQCCSSASLPFSTSPL